MTTLILSLVTLMSTAAPAPAAALDTPALQFAIHPPTGKFELRDKATGVSWARFDGPGALLTLTLANSNNPVSPVPTAIERQGPGLVARYRPDPNSPAGLRVTITPDASGRTLTVAYEADPGLNLKNVQLLGEALAIGQTLPAKQADGYVVVPVREGLLIPSDSKLAFTHRFDTYNYEGCHLAMVGLVQKQAALLVTWDDPYVAAEVRSTRSLPHTMGPPNEGGQSLTTTLNLRESARSVRVHVLGKGDCVTIAKAYREVARQRGWVVPFAEKLKGHPDRARLFGAANFKLWSCLDRRMDETSSRETSVKVNWTFDEVGQIADHLKHDLKLDKLLFMIGGWIHRGYDNQHPDILPAAPECGGDAGLSRAAQRVMGHGYIFCLHDNYQDIYRDAPSFHEKWVQKTRDGKLQIGGHWAGGKPYITCSKQALELAKRPQNLPAVKKLTGADSYFIDTTYACPLQECFDKEHPLTRADDMKWKQALSDYARGVFGMFGSECGREWAIPHADFFEGMTGVGGGYYHDKGLVAKVGGRVIPLFEMVYRDCLAMWGKYGYDIHQSAPNVTHHLAIGRPLYYHNLPPHLYWKEPARAGTAAPLQPLPATAEKTGPRTLKLTCNWQLAAAAAPEQPDWWVMVHFTDHAKQIRFQADHHLEPALGQWAPGPRTTGPVTVTVPDNLTGRFAVRVGLYQRPSLGRVTLRGKSDGEQRYIVGQLNVTAEGVAFEPAKPEDLAPAAGAGDPGLYVRGDGGWAQGLHPWDRYMKNTYEILSPVHELTAQTTVTAHAFLTPDRKVQRTVFGEGAAALAVLVNEGDAPYRHASAGFGEITLPPYGFYVESPSFVAFCATSFGGLTYAQPALFTVRSTDGKPVSESAKVRVYHGFGDARLKLGGKEHTVAKEATIGG